MSEPLSHVNEHIETSSRLAPAPSSASPYHHHNNHHNNRHHRHSQRSPPPSNSRSPLSSDEHTSGGTNTGPSMKGHRYKKIARYQPSDHHHRESYSSYSKHSSARNIDNTERSVRGKVSPFY